MKKGLISSGHLKGMSNRHCFVSFPHSWKPLIADVKFPTFKIESAKHSLIVSWAGCSHDPGEDIDSICINSKLLQINNFSEGESVIVRQIRCPAPATNVCVSAVSDSDWEVLVLNADAASEAFLSQMRVIVSDQGFPLWLEGAAVVYLKVIKFSTSASLGLIQSNTQVEILPPYTASSTWARHSPLVITPSKLTFEEESEICFKANFWYILYALFSLLRNSKKKIMYHPQQEALIEMRVIPYTMSINYKKSVLFTLIAYHPALVLISKKCLRPTMCQLPSYFIGKVSKINKKTSHNILPPSSRESTEKEVMAIILIWEMLKEKLDTEDIFELDALLKHKTCILSLSLTNKLSLEMEDIIALEICRGFNKSNYLTIDVTVKDDFPELKILASCLTSLLGELCEICPVILNDFCEMNLNVQGKNIDTIIKTRDNLPVYLDKNTLATLSVNTDVELNEIQVNKSITESVTESKNGSPRILIHEEALEELIKLIKRDLMFDFNSSLLSPQFTLVQGSKGSGKTTLMEALIDRLTQKPFFIHCEIIHLKHLKGKKVDSVQKILKNAIKEARNFQPSIIVLDDIDFLAPAPAKTEEENGMLFEYTYYMAFMIKNLLTQLLESMKRSSNDFVSSRELITVVATCCSRNVVHSILSTPKGNHIFPKSIHIQLINEESKLKVLEGFLKHWHEQYLTENITLFEKTDEQIFCYNKNEILFRLEGLTLSDIGILAHRIFLQSKARWKLQKDQCLNKCYIHEDMNNAFSGFVSLSSRGFKLPTTSQQFKKIGGLQKARASLNEMIVWPSQYPGVFSQTKLRLRSGLLLYGPPGCGKTLLAQSFNSIAHLRFIAVKGPELLSKYIGQSEKSVRDAFERAQSVKPCVLFFDEFESIAPRRGHDNTGVTDRVVNQLLTQMDGVEGLSGVYVVAATSRPDLIDPALLRPGRLDKGIYCPIPDESERREILSVFAEEISSEETLDLTDLSQKTDGFTGADLQSLFTTAQMKAAEEMFGAALYKVALDEPTSSNSVMESESSSEEFITVMLSKNNGIETTAGLARISEKTSPTIAVNSDDHVTNQSSNKNCVSIRKEHIEKALGEIRPSVNEKERLKYEVMHKMFSSDDENKMFTVVMAGKRETLA